MRPTDAVPLGTDLEAVYAESDLDRAMTVRAVHRPRRQDRQRARSRVTVPVGVSHGDHGHRRTYRLQQLPREGALGAVVRWHVDARRQALGLEQQVRDRFVPRIAHEQRRAVRRVRPDDEVAHVHRPLPQRREHAERQASELESGSGDQRHTAYPHPRDLLGPAAHERDVVHALGLDHHADLEPFQDLEQTAHVVGVLVRQDEHVYAALPRRERLAQFAKKASGVGTAVDEDVAPGRREEERVALAYVEGPDAGRVGGPESRHDDRRSQKDRHTT